MKKFDIKDYLVRVRRPGRYTGGEVNSVLKDPATVDLTFALAFPDVYEIAISHLGLQILYQELNARDDIAAERVYAPWKDMEALLRDNKMKLTTLESGRPLFEFDVIGFSLQYELSFTNIVNMLDLGGVPVYASERSIGDPIVIGGGPSAYNAEPIAVFFDAFLLGDGEEAILEISDALIKAKRESLTRNETLRELSRIEGVYVPAFFFVNYNGDGTIRKITPKFDDYTIVKKRIVKDLATLSDPVRPVVSFVEGIHDRLTVEIARGCTRGCRFCHAGMVDRPARERDPAEVERIIREGLANTGYDEVSLLSLSTGDYCSIEPLLKKLMDELVEKKVSVSLPSLRVGTLGDVLVNEIKKVKKTGFTLAPEAGTERLRRVISKGINADDLIETARMVYGLGWKTIKLYFMIGLPTETKEDLDGIIELSKAVRDAGGFSGGPRRKKKFGKGPKRNAPVSVSVGTFVPKPMTPFQWAPQIPLDECKVRQRYLKDAVERAGLTLKWQDAETSELEGVFARGDRLLSEAIYLAFKKGARFDGWSEEFKYDLWQEVFEESGVDTAFYLRERGVDETLPWDHLDCGVTKEFLVSELEASREGTECPDCKVDICTNCGVCDHQIIKNIVFKEGAAEGAGRDETTKRPPEEDPVRIRVNYTKLGDLRFVSHLELKDAMLRMIRRAGLNVRFSQGFHPQQKVSFNDPMPVGTESMDEYMDVELTRPMEAGELLNRLKAEAFPGLELLSADLISLQLPSLSANIIGTKYLIDVMSGPLQLKDVGIEFDRLEELLNDFMSLNVINVEIRRAVKTKVIDIKPFLADFAILGTTSLKLVLSNFDGPRVKPHEVLSRLFDIAPEEAILFPVLKTKSVLK